MSSPNHPPQNMDLLLVLAASSLAALLYILCVKLFFNRPFQNIPGPSSGSFLKGVYRTVLGRIGAHSRAGNVYQLTNRHSGEWIDELISTYGSLSKLSGPFGVRVVL